MDLAGGKSNRKDTQRREKQDQLPLSAGCFEQSAMEQLFEWTGEGRNRSVYASVGRECR